MKTEIKIPAMGESISEATVGEIFKPSNSQVSVDDEILELETDKVNQVLYAPQNGVITLTVGAGDAVKIGQVIGYIDDAGVAKSAEKVPEAKKTSEPTPQPQTVKPEVKPAEEKAPKSVAEPSVAKKGARLSKEGFIGSLKTEPEMKSVPQTQSTLTPADTKERRETRRKMSKIRQVIASRLVEAQHNTAMLTTFNEVDMSQVMSLREKYKEIFLKEHGVRLGFMPFFIKASVAALMAFPDINSYIEGNEIVHREYFDISIAVSTDRGLFVPVVRNCDHLSFAGIESAIETYAKKAKDGTIAVDDLKGGGFTITNGGVYGSLLSTPILNPPQSGILGMHKIMKRAVVVNDQIVIRPMMYLALSYDHRIVDGKEAVSFLVTLKNYLEDPARMLLDI